MSHIIWDIIFDCFCGLLFLVALYQIKRHLKLRYMFQCDLHGWTSNEIMCPECSKNMMSTSDENVTFTFSEKDIPERKMKTGILGDTLSSRGYTGSVEYSEDDGCWYGKILNIPDLFMYESDTELLLIQEFEKAVTDYINTKNVTE